MVASRKIAIDRGRRICAPFFGGKSQFDAYEQIRDVGSIEKIETVLDRKKIMCKVYSVSNLKGGGKTATCVNLGIGLARAGKRVCLIDADTQGSLTENLGFRQPDELDVTLGTVLGMVINEITRVPKS